VIKNDNTAKCFGSDYGNIFASIPTEWLTNVKSISYDD